MERRIFDLDLGRCCACSACVVACMDQNDFDTAVGAPPPRKAFEWEAPSESGIGCQFFSVACMHCADAPCIAACPTGCISRDPETGLVVYDNTGCIGCRGCSMACPFGAPTYRRDGKMTKCDGCNERLRHGLQPACVKACPTGALRCLTEEEYRGQSVQRSLRAVVGHITG